MSSTTTTPVAAGIYSDRPTWATTDPEVETGYLLWSRIVGDLRGSTVGLGRRDGLVGDTFSQIEPIFVSVFADERDWTPAEARQLAALLVQAANLAESQE
jgi:hypothetical protein